MRQPKERPMYNEEQKKAYISYEGSNVASLTNYFKRLYEYETLIDKDIIDMSLKELQSAINISMGVRSEVTASHIISLLRGYYDWALAEKRTKNEAYIHLLTPEGINVESAIRVKMIKSPEHLDDILSKALYDEQRENRNLIDQLVMRLMYIGIRIEELPYLLKNSIDENGIISFNFPQKDETQLKPRTYNANIDSEIQNLWAKCCRIEYVEKYGSTANNSDKILHSTLLDNNYLFRLIKGSKPPEDGNKRCSLSYFAGIIHRVTARYSEVIQCEINISPGDIVISGHYYRLYKDECSGVAITPALIADVFELDCNPDNLYIKTRKLIKDYESWKFAFGY